MARDQDECRVAWSAFVAWRGEAAATKRWGGLAQGMARGAAEVREVAAAAAEAGGGDVAGRHTTLKRAVTH